MSIIPGDDDPNTPPPPDKKPKLVCEFCSCQLTPVGDVLRMSDAAREYAKQTEQIRTLKAQLDQARSDADTFKRERDEANARLAQSSGDDDDDDDDDY
jgi:hypothetical protein